MAKRIKRVEINGRRFGFTYGATLLGFKEYRINKCAGCFHPTNRHGLIDKGKCYFPDCTCLEFEQAPLISFAVERPKIINHRVVKEIIMKQITLEKTP